jgi:hypothetical protein
VYGVLVALNDVDLFGDVFPFAQKEDDARAVVGAVRYAVAYEMRHGEHGVPIECDERLLRQRVDPRGIVVQPVAGEHDVLVGRRAIVDAHGGRRNDARRQIKVPEASGRHQLAFHATTRHGTPLDRTDSRFFARIRAIHEMQRDEIHDPAAALQSPRFAVTIWSRVTIVIAMHAPPISFSVPAGGVLYGIVVRMSVFHLDEPGLNRHFAHLRIIIVSGEILAIAGRSPARTSRVDRG